jgi:hypothetical protein
MLSVALAVILETGVFALPILPWTAIDGMVRRARLKAIRWLINIGVMFIIISFYIAPRCIKKRGVILKTKHGIIVTAGGPPADLCGNDTGPGGIFRKSGKGF